MLLSMRTLRLSAELASSTHQKQGETVHHETTAL